MAFLTFHGVGEIGGNKVLLEHFDINAPAHKPRYVHASGHASGAEIAQLIRDINPRAVFPIHTEDPGAFADMAPEGTTVVAPRTGERYAV